MVGRRCPQRAVGDCQPPLSIGGASPGALRTASPYREGWERATTKHQQKKTKETKSSFSLLASVKIPEALGLNHPSPSIPPHEPEGRARLSSARRSVPTTVSLVQCVARRDEDIV